MSGSSLGARCWMAWFGPRLALGLALVLPGCAPEWEAIPERDGAAQATEAPDCAECREARLHNRWCVACDVGYVASLPIASRKLFDTLDAHGHTLNRDKMSCETCKRLMDTGGLCESCRHGWVGGQAYFSKLTYSFALGEPHDVEGLECKGCRSAAEEGGWCEACDKGWVGNTRFDTREEHLAAGLEFERLRSAVEVSGRCETCAMYVLYDGTCPFCKLEYADGAQVAR